MDPKPAVSLAKRPTSSRPLRKESSKNFADCKSKSKVNNFRNFQICKFRNYFNAFIGCKREKKDIKTNKKFLFHAVNVGAHNAEVLDSLWRTGVGYIDDHLQCNHSKMFLFSKTQDFVFKIYRKFIAEKYIVEATGFRNMDEARRVQR